MSPQEQLSRLVKRAKDDPAKRERAEALLAGFSLAVQEIWRRGLTSGGRCKAIRERRDLLIAEFCELIDPLGLEDVTLTPKPRR